MSLKEAFLEIRDLTFGYSRRVILDDVTLKFGRGQVVAIMGGSGMGKTTLLKLIGGLLKPQKGEIIFDGEPIHTADLARLYAIRRRMGMLFQFGALFTDLSVFDNVAFPLREQTDLDEETIRDLVLMKLDAVGLRGAARLMPSDISGGMARRVALARAIALDPDLIMYDEPFAGLDPISMGVTAQLIRSRMGMLFQFGALFTDLSVFDNVAFPLREQTDLDEETIRDLVLMKLDAVGLRGAARLMPSDISGGMARRVALARAIALDPDLIMYDEPFAGLDPISMGVTAQLIRSLNDALGATAIIVTHDVAETFAIADYVYMVNAGRISAEGTPAQLSASDDPYVRQFLDAQPDGPVRFHYPADPIDKDFGVRTK